MNKKITLIVGLIILIVVVMLVGDADGRNQQGLKIGVVTPLTGGVAYWGESTVVGVRMAEEGLAKDGIKIKFILEDGQLDPKVALNAAQKLVNVDKVNAIFSEFNPASIAVSSFLEDKNVFHLYNSVIVSPLAQSPNNFKTYLDYQASCREVAKYLMDHKGVKKVGVLKMNLEHGNLCLKGIEEVFGSDNVVVEAYNPGVMDFRSLIGKITTKGADVIFHASYQPETLASIRQMDELGVGKLFVGMSENITPDIIEEYSPLINGDIFFGLPQVDERLKNQIKESNMGKDVPDYNAAALAYIHMLQLGRAVHKCGSDSKCTADYMAHVKPEAAIGFQGFSNRIAKFDNRIVQFVDGAFVEVE
jgi:branched-chain amino acid transport system substrate-binding protein